MAVKIPETYMDLVQQPAFANLATVMKDGSPHVTPVWFDYDGEFVRVNSARGRVKDRNMRNNPKVALSITDRERYVSIGAETLTGAVTRLSLA